MQCLCKGLQLLAGSFTHMVRMMLPLHIPAHNSGLQNAQQTPLKTASSHTQIKSSGHSRFMRSAILYTSGMARNIQNLGASKPQGCLERG